MLVYFWFLPPLVTIPCSRWSSPLQVEDGQEPTVTVTVTVTVTHPFSRQLLQPLIHCSMDLFCRAAYQSSPDADVRDLLLHSSEETSQVKRYHHVKQYNYIESRQQL